MDMATEVPKTDGDPVAPDDQAPDAPALPTAAENAVANERDQHLPGAREWQRHKTVDNYAATESKEQGAEKELQESPTPSGRSASSSRSSTAGSGRKALASKENKSCTGSRTVAAKKTRKVAFNATPVKAARGAGSGKGGANDGSGSAGDGPD